MVCHKLKEKFSLYMDGALSDSEMRDIQEHLAYCARCGQEYKEMQETMEMLRMMPEVSAPPEFRSQVLTKIQSLTSEVSVDDEGNTVNGPVLIDEVVGQKETTNNTRALMINRILSWVSAAAVLFFAVGITWQLTQGQVTKESQQEDFGQTSDSRVATNGDQSSNEKISLYGARAELAEGAEGALTKDMPTKETLTEKAPTEEAPTEEDLTIKVDDAVQEKSVGSNPQLNATPAGPAGSRGPAVLAGGSRMVSNEGNLTLQVADVNKVHNQIVQIAEQAGGYVETANYSSNETKIALQSQAGIRIRIPMERFAEVFNRVQDYGVVTVKDMSGQDITTQYQEANVKVNQLKEQENRLLALVKQNNKLDDSLKLENELSHIRQELTVTESELKRLSSLAVMSTITIELVEKAD